MWDVYFYWNTVQREKSMLLKNTFIYFKIHIDLYFKWPKYVLLENIFMQIFNHIAKRNLGIFDVYFKCIWIFVLCLHSHVLQLM